MNKRAVLLPVVLVFALLACTIGTPTMEPEATPDPNQIATAVAETLAAMSPTGEDTSPAPLLPTDTAEPGTPEPGLPTDTAEPETPAPGCLPVHPGAVGLPLPAGVAIGEDEDIKLFNLSGSLLADRPVAGMTFMDEQHVHFAGNLGAGANNLPIVFFTLQGGGALKQNVNNAISNIGPAGDLDSLTGSSGGSFLTYVSIDWSNQWTNTVFTGTSAGLSPRFIWVPPADGHIGNAIRPLAIHTAAGSADGIWYTYTMVGIGDIHYPPYNGLFYYDLSSGVTTEFLSADNAIGGLSPDQTRVAYGPGQGGAPGVIRTSFTIRNLVTCQESVVAFNPASNLGGGWMVFSPDNSLVAWTEAGGPNNMEASFRLRVANTDGTSLFDSPLASLTSFLGGEAPDYLTTVGWAANHILTMQAYLNVINQYVVILWAPLPDHPIDPVLGAHQAVPVADGEFIGMIYP
jgi:hypothetical protein